jgi:hypothetical protein
MPHGRSVIGWGAAEAGTGIVAKSFGLGDERCNLPALPLPLPLPIPPPPHFMVRFCWDLNFPLFASSSSRPGPGPGGVNVICITNGCNCKVQLPAPTY